MSQSSHPHDELSQLLMEQLDGQLTIQQHARLQDLLRNDPAACAEYARLMALQALLDSELNELLPPLTLEDEPLAQPARKPVKMPVPWTAPARRSLAAVPLALAMLLAVGLGLWWFTQPPLVAELRHTETALWGEGAELADGHRLTAGRQLHLLSGRAEVIFASGAKAILEGPANLTVESAAAGRLKSGKLTVYVPKPATGFAVHTPLATVVDLGTRFGLETRSDYLSVNVLEGRVQVAPEPVASHQGPQSGPLFSPQPLVLVAGESLRIDSDGGIVRTSEEVAQPLGKITAREYQQIVLSLNPSSYLPMEPVTQDLRSLANLAVPDQPGKLSYTGQDSPFVLGRMGQALRLRSQGNGDRAVVATNSMNVLTLASWIYLDAAAAHETTLIRLSWDEKRGGASLGISASGELQAGGWVMVDKVRKRHEEVRESGTAIPTGVWQHVAFVVDGSQFALYRNGEVVAVRRDGAHQLYEGTSAAGELNIGPGPVRVDEVVLFERALSTQEVRSLYESSDGAGQGK